jgi:flagellar assembly protein FliH
MSPSARRLAGGVPTDRFQWQRQAAPSAGATPLLRRSEPASPVPPIAPAMRDLPSPSAERLHALEREAFEKGHAEGLRAGEHAAAQQAEPVMQRLLATIDEIASLRTGVMRRSERELVRLALAMAERIVRREIDIDKELLSVMARVAIDRIGEHAVATIHLHPSDCEVALSQRDPAQPGPVEIVADVNVPRGGCLVRSAFGSVDMGIDSQMRELARALLGDDDAQEEPAHGLSADV